MHKPWGSSRREQTFEQLYRFTGTIHLYLKRWPRSFFRPPHIIVGIRVCRETKDGHMKERQHYLCGDRFFAFLVARGHITNDKLREFFPCVGTVFDVANGKVSRVMVHTNTIIVRKDERLPQRFEESRLGEWPCFHPDEAKLAEFVRTYLRRTVNVHVCTPKGSLRSRMRLAESVLLVRDSGEMRMETNGAQPKIRIGCEYIASRTTAL